MSVLGFGVIARFAEAIPFLIPGLVIGGSILYHTRILNEADLQAGKKQKLPA